MKKQKEGYGNDAFSLTFSISFPCKEFTLHFTGYGKNVPCNSTKAKDHIINHSWFHPADAFTGDVRGTTCVKHMPRLSSEEKEVHTSVLRTMYYTGKIPAVSPNLLSLGQEDREGGSCFGTIQQ